MKLEMNGKTMQLSTDQELTMVDFFKLIQKHLSVDELLRKIPDLVKNLEIPVNEIANGLSIEQKTWEVYKALLINGLNVEQTREWFEQTDINPEIGYPDSPQELNWMLKTLLLGFDRGPDFLAAALKDFLRKLLDVPENLMVLIGQNVSSDVLVKVVLTKGQITDHLKILLKNGANIDLIIKKVGYYPYFYKRNSINYLVEEAGATPLSIAREIFSMELQPLSEETEYLRQLRSCGLHLSDFVNQVVMKGKHLHVVTDNAYYFKVINRVDVRSILKDLRLLDMQQAENVLDLRLTVITNYSKLNELGIITKAELKKWKKAIGSFRVNELMDTRSGQGLDEEKELIKKMKVLD